MVILPASAVVILGALRALMLREGIGAYIVPAEDEHYTEFVSPCHERRAYISNFTGSAGTGIITMQHALLWTDGRYYLQAEQEMDSDHWTLMKDGLLETPSQASWLISNLTQGTKVGVDPKTFSKSKWDSMATALAAGQLELIAVETNLVDEIWDSRPPCSSNLILNLDLKYAGKNTSEKVKDVRDIMRNNNASVLVVTELDEAAWLLNLRGRDIPSSSTFFAFIILTQNRLELFVNTASFPENVRLIVAEQVLDLSVLEYTRIYDEFPRIIAAYLNGMVWLNRNANYKLVRSVPNENLLLKLTPISTMKAIKNEVEVEGYRNALIRDCAALCEFFAWLEDAMEKGDSVTEISAAEKLYNIRQNRSELFFDQSFPTISATGKNAAVIHYMPTIESSRPLSKNEIYLVDSGADGTTDITRTILHGIPTGFQMEAYTRVLKGQIALTEAKFPEKTTGQRLDSFARQALWLVGLDYSHGTGHGIGAFLNVHEGPQGIGSGYRADDPGLQENMFTSNEPGFYDEENEFGIRLENIIRVRKVNLTHNFQEIGFLGFEDLTFLPYQQKLIDTSLLTEDEISYLNEYHKKTQEIIVKYLNENNFPQQAIDWVIKETVPIEKDPTVTTIISTITTETPVYVSTTVPPSTTSSAEVIKLQYGKQLPLLLLLLICYDRKTI